MARYEFGLQEAGFNPGSVGHGEASHNVYDPNFDFNKYDRDYNPWGTEAEKASFEETLNQNLDASAAQYGAIKKKLYGYSYETMSVSPGPGSNPYQDESNIQLDDAGRYLDKRKYTQNTGQGGRYFGTQDDVFQGSGDSWDPDSTTDKYGNTVMLPGANADKYIGDGARSWDGTQVNTVNVKPTDLTDIEEYMLWRYDVRYAQTQQNVGLGESAADTGLGYMGQDIDKTGATGLGRGQKGPVIGGQVGRSERATGKAAFTRDLKSGGVQI